MLHDTGLLTSSGDADFTLESSRVAREVAGQVGLSEEATTVILDAITLHHSPGVGPEHGAVAQLLSAGAAVDVIGLHAWQLPDAVLSDAVALHPGRGSRTSSSRRSATKPNAFRRDVPSSSTATAPSPQRSGSHRSPSKGVPRQGDLMRSISNSDTKQAIRREQQRRRTEAAHNGALGLFWHLARHLEGPRGHVRLLASGGGSPSSRARVL